MEGVGLGIPACFRVRRTWGWVWAVIVRKMGDDALTVGDDGVEMRYGWTGTTVY